MGMMLRRNNRRAEYTPQVNGKPVKQEPKNRSLTEKTIRPQSISNSATNYNK
jgi:hypothetical protein